ncbi:MAG TPA: hypothetical protein VFY29_04470 [Terriglobia bacterium]|nr:hypothetical protein [Terriglobia bacterium]
MTMLPYLLSLLLAQQPGPAAGAISGGRSPDGSGCRENGTLRVVDGIIPSYITLEIDGKPRGVQVRGPGRQFCLPLDPGSRTINVAHPLGYYVASITSGNTDITKAPLIVTPDMTSPPINIVLTTKRPAGPVPGVSVTGLVTNLDALKKTSPRSKVLLTLRYLPTADPLPSDPIVGHVTMDETGAFNIEGLAAGRYTLEDSLPFDVGTSDLANLEVQVARVRQSAAAEPKPPNPPSIVPVNVVVVTRDGNVPAFEIGFTPTRDGGAPQIVAVSRGESSLSVLTGEYRVHVAGLPGGYTLESVTAGPLDLTDPFLITDAGIADRFTGAPVLGRSESRAAGSNVPITVRLTSPPAAGNNIQ